MILKNKLFVEKYRPEKIDDCILPKNIKKELNDFVKNGDIPNLILSGSSGVGKTTIAKILSKEMGFDELFINASEEGIISTLRETITNFVTSLSLEGNGMKLVILDEFDYSNINSFQPALRGFIEKFSKTTRFIITCNYKERIMPEIFSRCSLIEFVIPKEETIQIAKQYLERLSFILKEEGVECDNKKILSSLIKKHFPDFRKVLNEVQKYSSSGSIDSNILADDANIKSLMKCLKEKNFQDCRKWIFKNNIEEKAFFNELYHEIENYLEPSSIPVMILLLADFSYKSSFIFNRSITLSAFFLEVMKGCKFK